MSTLIKKYINNLDTNKLNDFLLKNDIHLNNNELTVLLNLIKTNIDDILVNDYKYLDILKEKIDSNNYNKIKELFLYYKNRYQGYLF